MRAWELKEIREIILSMKLIDFLALQDDVPKIKIRLIRSGIGDLEVFQLINISGEQITGHFRNLGKSSVYYLQKCLEKYGLSLRKSETGLSTWILPYDMQMPIKEVVARLDCGLQAKLKISNTFRTEEITTLGALLHRSEFQLMRIPRLGKVSIAHINKALSHFGLALKK